MSEHECVIGELYDYDNTRLVTTNELLQEIKDRILQCKYMNDLYKEYTMIDINIRPNYTLKDYCDRRKSTNLTRFEFCPYCGKKIDWKKIKEENKDE